MKKNMLASLSKALLIFCPILLVANNLLGQQQQLESPSKEQLTFKVLPTKDSRMTFEEAYGNLDKFLPKEQIHYKTHPDETYWVMLDFEKLEQSLSKNEKYFLTLNCFDYGKVYYQKNGRVVNEPIGQFNKNTLSNKTSSSIYHCEIPIRENALINNRFLFLQVKRVKFIESIENWTFSIEQSSNQNAYTWSAIKLSIPIYIYLGVGFIMSIAMLIFYIYFGKIEFLLYSLFVLSIIIYLFHGELILPERLQLNNSFIISWLWDTNAIILGILYLMFALFYLNLKKEYPRTYVFIKIGIYAHVILLITDLFFFAFRYHLGHIYLLQVLRVVSFLITISFLIYLFIYNKNRISTIFLIGGSSYMISIFIYYYINLGSDSDPMFYGNSLVLIIGSILEIIFFAYGLTYKAFNEYLKRLYFEQEAITNENKALRAQINPHFIFNALGSIQHLILKKKNDSALNYLTKFSRMARNALEASVEGTGTLDEEIEMLNDYLELESLRFDNAFSYSLDIDGQLDTSEIEIPFMISQPFVENAIIHGLLPKTSGQKELTITMKEEENILKIIINDTGVGRNQAHPSQGIYVNKKKARGLDVTINRLENWHFGSGKVEILDKVNDTNEPLGTEVIISIPLEV
ncbi:sensor histidine kinase [Muricauda brasiliensis]|uniref:sensor histidine kinase n=1 Tax=Muricauda brasiliensis TaxID=2162892 RepID=UPI000D3B9048|nr:histidine kinase [Muricauda brasiliensis]